MEFRADTFLTNYYKERKCEIERIHNMCHENSGEKKEDYKKCPICLEQLSSGSFNIHECCGAPVHVNCSVSWKKNYLAKHKSAVNILGFKRSIDANEMDDTTRVIQEFTKKKEDMNQSLNCPYCRQDSLDSEKRLSYLKINLEKEHPWAYYAMSIAYRDGENGVPKNGKEGWKICQTGCEKEYPSLQFLWAQARCKKKFGDFKLPYHGNEHDYIPTLEAAARGGHPEAQDLLAYHYWHSIGGVTPNREEALKLFRLSLAAQYNSNNDGTKRIDINMDKENSFFQNCSYDLFECLTKMRCMDVSLKSGLDVNVNVIIFWAIHHLNKFGPEHKVLEVLVLALSKGIQALSRERQELCADFKSIRRSVLKSLMKDFNLKETCASCHVRPREEDNQLSRCEGW